METKFNFKSQICTDKIQSERLLALGLKKETADMYMPPSWGGSKIIGYYAPDVVTFDDHFDENPNDLPAWSLHRLLELNLLCCEQHFAFQFHITNVDDAYEYLVSHIEWLIKEGYFNKEYLEE